MSKLSKEYLPFLFGICLTIVWLILPLFLSPYWVTVLTEMLIYGLFAMSLDIVNGYAGFPSFGHAAFFGTGAYVLGISLLKLGQSQWMSVLLALGAILIVSAIIGVVALRGRGIYFLFITLALSQTLWAIAWKWNAITGGDDGLSDIARPDLGLFWWNLLSARGFYYFVLFVFVIAFLALYLITESPLGQSFTGIRESELRMRSLGYNVWVHSYLALIISGFFGGLAGILFAWYNKFVCPSQLGVTLSAQALFMGILGGPGTLWGPLLGAIIIVLVKDVASLLTIHWLLIMGAFYVIIIIYMPQGIGGIIKRRWAV